ncbi:MAG: hypothetical protein J6R88_01130, partial [Clostridia bacterium]|nr:hypothetical protein [Clostridia bacterium]
MENLQSLPIKESTKALLNDNLIVEQPLNVEEDTVSVKNNLNNYFSSGEELKKTLAIFGQSEEEIEKEFKNYKAQKVFNKLSYLI